MLLIYGAKPRKIFIFQLLHMPGNNIYRMFRILTTGKFKKFLKTFWKLGNSWKFRRNHIHVTLTSHGTRKEWMTISFVKNVFFKNFNNWCRTKLIFWKKYIGQFSKLKIIIFGQKYSLNNYAAPTTVLFQV